MAQMAQATQNERATDELLLGGIIAEEKFVAFLRDYSIPQSTSPDAPALMLLESQPRHVIERDAQQELLHFAFFDPSFDFMPYTTGRIFHASGELRWERQQSAVQIVYTGRKEYKPALQDARETMLDAYIPRDRTYLLFGKRLDRTQLDRISSARSGDFAEVRIPRLLRYPQLPTLANAERVQLVMREYIDPTTALNFAYRFQSLVHFQK